MDRLQAFEREAGLFGQRVDGLPWWDSVRYQVFEAIGGILTAQSVLAPTQPPAWRRLAGQAFRAFQRRQMMAGLARDSGHVLSIRTPRSGLGDSPVDTAVDPVAGLFPGDSRSIDIVPRRYHVPMPEMSRRSGSVPADLQAMLRALAGVFGLPEGACAHLEAVVRHRRLVFEKELATYRRLLDLARPELVLVANPVEKALFHAARERGVTTVEPQHGLISFAHAGYSYAPDIDYSGLTTLPDLFLTLSPHWSRVCHYPARSQASVGNGAFVQDAVPPMPLGAVMVVSSSLYHQVLARRTRLLAGVLPPERKILYKLHPNQRGQMEAIIAEFADLPTVEVVAPAIPAATLMAGVSHVVVLSSTLAYEALQAGRRVCIIPALDYRGHSDILDLPQVGLAADTAELARLVAIPCAAGGDAPHFFDRFDREKARAAIGAAIRRNGRDPSWSGSPPPPG